MYTVHTYTLFAGVSKMLEDEQKQMTEWEARHTFTDNFRSAAEVSYTCTLYKACTQSGMLVSHCHLPL